ncbi:MAG: secondary thiamine-phosphate synthase enzyme YjbQ [Candidatus Hadarchaeales archaeon]
MVEMRTYVKEFTFTTKSRREIVDLTDRITEIVKESKIKNGILLVQLPHATASIVLNEGEKGLEQDILEKLDDLVPVRGNYHHDMIDDNAHAHIKAAILGSSKVLPIVDGEILRGAWQNFLVVEEDGPRTRRVVVFMIGE